MARLLAGVTFSCLVLTCGRRLNAEQLLLRGRSRDGADWRDQAARFSPAQTDKQMTPSESQDKTKKKEKEEEVSRLIIGDSSPG